MFSLLKFCGAAAADGVSYLADFGIGKTAQDTAPSYPIAIHRLELRDIAVNLLTTLTGSLTIELLRNGSVVSDFTITYAAGESGVKKLKTDGKTFKRGDTLDVRVTNADAETDANLSVTIGIDPQQT